MKEWTSTRKMGQSVYLLIPNHIRAKYQLTDESEVEFDVTESDLDCQLMLNLRPVKLAGGELE